MAGSALIEAIHSLQDCAAEEDTLDLLNKIVKGLTTSLQLTLDVQQKTNDGYTKYVGFLEQGSDKLLPPTGLCPDSMSGHIHMLIERLRTTPDTGAREQLYTDIQVSVNQLAMLLHTLEREKRDLVQENMMYTSIREPQPPPPTQEEYPMSLDYEVVEREHVTADYEHNYCAPQDYSMMSIRDYLNPQTRDLSAKHIPENGVKVNEEYEDQLRHKDDLIQQLQLQLLQEQEKVRELQAAITSS